VTASDSLAFVLRALFASKLRGSLTLLAMAIGVASVVILTGLGEGARRFVTDEFRALGTNLLIVFPGRSETVGGPPPVLAATPRDLTIEDAMALLRCRSVAKVSPLAVGAAAVSWGGKEREATVIGTNHEFLAVRQLTMAKGSFLPPMDPRRSAQVCAIGVTIRDEIFGAEEAIGRWLRVGDRRFRVAGIIASEGRALGFDLDEMVVIPVASAQDLFNTFSLIRILVEGRSREELARSQREVVAVLRERHDGEDDVTVITQDSVLAAFDKVLKGLTFTVAGIAAISLAVAGILIMNVMLVSVSQRTAEIGLLKALGAPPDRILRLFLLEATCLAFAGGILGLAAGGLAVLVARKLYPSFPVGTPAWAVAAALITAVVTGLVFAVLPARRAARLDPVASLARR
jgi:putative ABC transport system permease protein